jgi:hypothetical protein
MKIKATFKGIVTRTAFAPDEKGEKGAANSKVLSVQAGGSKELTDQQLAKINTYARKPLTKEQIHYVRLLMAHNGIDRDVERFAEDLLVNFANTLPGKGFFVQGHPSAYKGTGAPGEGLYFDAQTENMTPEEFKHLTSEDIELPDGITGVKVLFGDAYLLALDSNADTRAKIDAGIYRFASIGFKAPLYDITDERGNYIYGEYRPGGEAREGSLVWLGAQPGAGVMKSAKGSPETAEQPNKEMEGRKQMIKALVDKINKTFKTTFTEENAGDNIVDLIQQKDTEIEALKPKAADGDAYRRDMLADIGKFGALIGELPKEDAAQKTEMDFIVTMPIDRVKTMRDKYEAKAREMFPAQFIIQTKSEEEKKQKEDAAGPKDFSKDNPLDPNKKEDK